MVETSPSTDKILKLVKWENLLELECKIVEPITIQIRIENENRKSFEKWRSFTPNQQM